MNVGLLSWAGYALYDKPHLRRDVKVLASAATAALTILGAEGYAAEKYRQTPAGREEERRAKKEGAALYRHAREHILRPGVLGGLVGVGESHSLDLCRRNTDFSCSQHCRHWSHQLLGVQALGRASLGQTSRFRRLRWFVDVVVR